MDENEYKLICSLETFPSSTEPQLSVSEDTFALIKRQVRHHQLRSELRTHRQEKCLKKYVARLDAGESMNLIATSVSFSPCMMARLLLDAKYGWSKTTISTVFKEALRDESEEEVAAPNCRGLSKDEYARIMREIRECIEQDVIGSPLADRVRHNMGVEYEYLLLETLRNRHFVYESEDTLREKGMSKTPDVRLLLPFGVKNTTSGRLHVVNWIDSKAMFGDRQTHETENASQLQGYVNRYGPGMVIYWFGHVTQLSSDHDILIVSSFPNEVLLPGAFDPLAGVTKVREGAQVKLQPAKVHTDFDDDWIPMITCELYPVLPQ